MVNRDGGSFNSAHYATLADPTRFPSLERLTITNSFMVNPVAQHFKIARPATPETFIHLNFPNSRIGPAGSWIASHRKQASLMGLTSLTSHKDLRVLHLANSGIIEHS